MSKNQTVRLEIPADQHTYLLDLAAKEGVALEQFIIERLPKKDHQDLPQEEFDQLLKELLEEKESVLKRLSDDAH
jgi:hypothetical protein